MHVPQNARTAALSIILGGLRKPMRIVYHTLAPRFPITKAITEGRIIHRTLALLPQAPWGTENRRLRALWDHRPVGIQGNFESVDLGPEESLWLGNPPIDESKVVRVKSVNAEGVINLLCKLSPAAQFTSPQALLCLKRGTYFVEDV